MKTTTDTNPHAAGEAAHTPLPWAVSSSTMLVSTSDERDMPIIGNLIDLMGVSSIGIREARANAAFIVRACNSHAQLVEALKHADRTLGVVLSYFHGQAGQGLAKTLTAESVDEIRATLAAMEAAQ